MFQAGEELDVVLLDSAEPPVWVAFADSDSADFDSADFDPADSDPADSGAADFDPADSGAADFAAAAAAPADSSSGSLLRFPKAWDTSASMSRGSTFSTRFRSTLSFSWQERFNSVNLVLSSRK